MQTYPYFDAHCDTLYRRNDSRELVHKMAYGNLAAFLGENG